MRCQIIAPHVTETAPKLPIGVRTPSTIKACMVKILCKGKIKMAAESQGPAIQQGPASQRGPAILFHPYHPHLPSFFTLKTWGIPIISFISSTGNRWARFLRSLRRPNFWNIVPTSRVFHWRLRVVWDRWPSRTDFWNFCLQNCLDKNTPGPVSSLYADIKWPRLDG